MPFWHSATSKCQTYKHRIVNICWQDITYLYIHSACYCVMSTFTTLCLIHNIDATFEQFFITVYNWSIRNATFCTKCLGSAIEFHVLLEPLILSGLTISHSLTHSLSPIFTVTSAPFTKPNFIDQWLVKTFTLEDRCFFLKDAVH